MSQRPISRSADLKKLRDEGYDLEIRSGCLLVKDVPYVNSRKEVKRGILVMKLVLADDQTGRPDTHVAYFSGSIPAARTAPRSKNKARKQHPFACRGSRGQSFVLGQAQAERLVSGLLLPGDDLCRDLVRTCADD